MRCSEAVDVGSRPSGQAVPARKPLLRREGSSKWGNSFTQKDGSIALFLQELKQNGVV